MPCANIFHQQLLTYINRMIIIKQQDFIVGVIQTELSQKGYSFEDFVKAWLGKMDMVVSWEAHRIKTLAILCMLPHLSSEMIQAHFVDIAKLTFEKLEHELFLRITNNDQRFSSPSRFNQPSKIE